MQIAAVPADDGLRRQLVRNLCIQLPAMNVPVTFDFMLNAFTGARAGSEHGTILYVCLLPVA